MQLMKKLLEIIVLGLLLSGRNWKLIEEGIVSKVKNY